MPSGNAKNCGGAFGLFFLGHMAWAYVWAVVVWALIPGDKRGGKLFVPAILMLGVLPDIDLLLRPFGVAHHTFIHSFFFWFIIFVPFLVVYRQKSIPYLVAVVQHFAFGDLLVGNVMIFWPFSSSYFGVNIAMPSIIDVALETAGLLLAAGIIILNGDLRRLLSVDKGNIAMFLPFLALVASMLFFAVDKPIIPLVTYIWSRKLFTILVLGHIILGTFLAVSTARAHRYLERFKKHSARYVGADDPYVGRGPKLHECLPSEGREAVCLRELDKGVFPD